MVKLQLELLAPAGDDECLRAAVAAGADAVYFGLTAGFNARAKATNIPVETLGDTFAFLHGAGVRGYVTLNTLLFDDELMTARDLVCKVAQAGADAVIVQDLGLARLCHTLVPNLPLHASTQMTVSSPEAARFVAELGVSRVVLPRELSLAEIDRFRTTVPVELECFVHGALCISYSGQCLASAAGNGRSANRGLCAQPCRMAYGLQIDGKPTHLGQERYLLAPKDLAAYDRVQALAQAGVCSFKIEGRYKGPDYVTAAVEKYRKVIDAVEEGLTDSVLTRADVEDLAFTFNRGFTHGWLDGPNHQQLCHGLYPGHRGLLVGTVESVRGFSVFVRPVPDAPELRPGDWMLFGQGDPEGDEPRGGIFSMGPERDGLWDIRFGDPGPNLALVKPGNELWKSHDSAIKRRLKKVAETKRRITIRLKVTGREGSPLAVSADDELGRTATVESDQLLCAAHGRGLTPAILTEKLAAFGATQFELHSLDFRVEGSVGISPASIKRLRRALVTALEAQGIPSPTYEVHQIDSVSLMPAQTRAESSTASEGASSPAIVPLCRSPQQVEAVLQCSTKELYLDLPDLSSTTRAVELCRHHGACVLLATPRIHKPGDEESLRRLASLGPDGLLVRCLGALGWCRSEAPGLSLRGDFSLNVANSLTAQLFLEQGLVSLTLSYDLEPRQLAALINDLPAGAVEVPLRWRVPLFHTEYCLFAKHLSGGHTKRDCGHPCRRQTLALLDHRGRALSVLADSSCRNTVFDRDPQVMPARDLTSFRAQRFRVELIDEDGPATKSLLEQCQRDLASKRSGETHSD
ncbi:MAG: hypothetical protein A2289_13025 [Deltaproteobacteria bacterium RIFOXYA12_FULL_58_15]|nr:MAG: hypothetical protein A2289_13025 [Deltaproteobacteria bacterium RIFOXYA12_FULL_58_15]